MTVLGNRLYPKGKDKFGTAQINWPADTVVAVLVDLADYTPDFTNHEFLSDIPAVARVSVSPPLTGKTVTAGVFNCDNFAFQAVSGDVSEAIVFVKKTADDATSALILYYDDADILPVTPNGGNIAVTIDPDDKLFAI